jgi:Peptidase family M28/PDZ domain
MKINFIAVVAIAAALTSCVSTKAPTSSELTQLKADVFKLASDEFEGRAIGTIGADKAASYIESRFKEIGLKPLGTDGYFQPFSFIPQGHGQIHQVGDSTVMGKSLVKEINGKNVVGFWDNGQPYTIVIGAHYDHLGWGDENSLWTGEKAIHNGADDNASGVAAMIELAKLLGEHDKSPKYNYLFIAFSGEEKGLWGSNYFSKHPTIPIESINCMINMDMVGRMNKEKALSISGTGTTQLWEPLLTEKNNFQFKLIFDKSGIGPSDHSSFYNQGIPVLHFFTGQHADYHKPSDDYDKLNYDGMENVIAYIHSICLALNSQEKLAFTKTADPVKQNNTFKVTLGVMPDYMFGGTGMRIDGVKENRPAALSGMKQGDVVVRMGEIVISDMTSYMEALGKFNEGQTIEVEIIRDGQSIKLPVTFK